MQQRADVVAQARLETGETPIQLFAKERFVTVQARGHAGVLRALSRAQEHDPAMPSFARAIVHATLRAGAEQLDTVLRIGTHRDTPVPKGLPAHEQGVGNVGDVDFGMSFEMLRVTEGRRVDPDADGADNAKRWNGRAGPDSALGGASSSTTCALVPPMPKELTPVEVAHLRLPRVLSVAVCRTACGRGRASDWLCEVGGRGTIRCSRANTVLMKPAMPAAVSRWPMLALTDPSAHRWLLPVLLNTCARAATSIGSPSGVPVPEPR